MNAHLESVLGCTGELAPPEDMRDLVKPEYSKREVVNAGKFIARRGIQATDEAIELFGVAHNWRDSYVAPMMRVRQELGGKVRRVQRGAVTAARLKRMQSIRRKLQTLVLIENSRMVLKISFFGGTIVRLLLVFAQ